LFATGINNTIVKLVAKFAAGVVDIPVANLPSLIPVVNLELRISPRIFEKILETAPMLYSGAWGKLIHEKTRIKKIS
jgi:hypothetical protein